MSGVLLVGLGAGLGAALRFLAARRWDGAVPRGTLLANTAGSFALGGVVGLGVSEELMLLLGVGFAGGLTTYSAFAVQVQALSMERPRPASAYAVATLGLSFVAGALGWTLGRYLGTVC